jgi:hypothetical protein
MSPTYWPASCELFQAIINSCRQTKEPQLLRSLKEKKSDNVGVLREY